MTSALTLKELRESAGLAGLALLGLIVFALMETGNNPLWFLFNHAGTVGEIPFLGDSFNLNFWLAAAALAVALGLKQSLGDLWNDAHLFWMHRPVSRRQVYLTKVAVGLGLYLILAAVPLAIYSIWAATPGTHASPFAWSMAVPVWISWLAVSLIYLGAMLSGIRPGAWFGTRLVPLAAAVATAAFAAAVPAVWAVIMTAVGATVLVVLIVYVAESRDFA